MLDRDEGGGGLAEGDVRTAGITIRAMWRHISTRSEMVVRQMAALVYMLVRGEALKHRSKRRRDWAPTNNH